MQQPEAMTSTKLPPRGSLLRARPLSMKGKKLPATAFRPGQSGNPAGRPKGSPNALSLLKHQVISSSGMTPLEFLTFAYRNQLYKDYVEELAADGKTVVFRPAPGPNGKPEKLDVPLQLRASCAQAAAPYVHKKMPVGIEVKEKNAAIISTEKLRSMPTAELARFLDFMDKLGMSVDLAATREVGEEE